MMRSPLRIVVAAGLVAVAARGGAVLGTDHPLALGEALAMALERNEGIIVVREAYSSAEAAVSGAKGAYDPVLGLEAGWRQVAEPTNSAFSGAPPGRAAPTDETAEAGASLSQLLPTGGEISLRTSLARRSTDGAFALLSPAYGLGLGVELRQPLLRRRSLDAARLALRITAVERERAGAELQRGITETVATVERAYWRLVAAAREIQVREEAMRLAEEQLGETGLRIESGDAPETEIAQPRAELERRRGELLASREAATRAQNALKRLILADNDETLWLERLAPAEEAALAVQPANVAQALESAFAARPEIEVATKAVERRRAEAAFAREGIRPTLDAVLSYDRFGLAGERNPADAGFPGQPGDPPAATEGGWSRSLGVLADGVYDDARVALVFGFPVGNRAARAAAAEAGSAVRQAEADLAGVRKAVRAEVLDAAAALETTGQRIEAARAAREAAEVQLAAERDRYGAGLSTNFLVLTRQNDLARARLDEISSLTDYRIARSEMARATGSLLEERHIAVESGTPEPGREGAGS